MFPASHSYSPRARRGSASSRVCSSPTDLLILLPGSPWSRQLVIPPPGTGDPGHADRGDSRGRPQRVGRRTAAPELRRRGLPIHASWCPKRSAGNLFRDAPGICSSSNWSAVRTFDTSAFRVDLTRRRRMRLDLFLATAARVLSATDRP